MKNRQPLVTIGIPTFNRVDGLAHTLKCATEQSYKNLEILVADNCTEDKAAIDILMAAYSADKRVRYFRHAQNNGALHNFSFLIKQAAGKYFIFMPDDDDYDNPEMIAAGVEALESNPGASVAIGAIEYVDGNNSVFEKDNIPYGLHGLAMARILRYITHNVTDHLMYGLLRFSVIQNYQFIKGVRTPEKFFILHIILNGSVADVAAMSWRNIYSFKSIDEAQAAISPHLLSGYKHWLNWYRSFFSGMPFWKAIVVSVIFTFVRLPKIGWPYREIFGIRELPGRIKFHRPLKKKWG